MNYHILIIVPAVVKLVSAEWIDMSYHFDDQTVYWPGIKHFYRTQMQGGMRTEKEPNYVISAHEHGGTHSDAPSHFYEKGLTVDKVPIKNLVGPAVVVNISEKAAKNPEYSLSVEDLLEWERANGKIPNGAIVLLHSGWGKYWPDNTKFMGIAAKKTSGLHFPGFHPEAADWIVKSGKVKAVGVDTASLDYGQTKVYDSHSIFAKANLIGFEMVANLDKLPPRGATIFGFPIKTKGGTGGPTRIFAEIGNEKWCKTELTDITWLDMTHPLVNGTVYWPGSTAFSLRSASIPNRGRDGYYIIMYEYTASEHSGTHLDSPIHFADDKWSTHEIPLDNLIGPAIKIDISEKAAKNSSYQLKPSDIEEWEKRYGKVPKGAIVLVHTGWGKFWPDKLKYYGMKHGKTISLKFPGIHPAAATWMVKRKVKAVGVDTPSLDYGFSKDFPSHQILFKANIPGFQSVANLDKLPFIGATVFAAPMKIKNGNGGPLRIVAKIGGDCSTSGAVNGAVTGHLLFFITALCVYYINF